MLVSRYESLETAGTCPAGTLAQLALPYTATADDFVSARLDLEPFPLATDPFQDIDTEGRGW